MPLQNPDKIEKIGGFFKRVSTANREYIEHWTHETLFKWDFWLSWCFALIPWALWFRFRKKESTGRLLLGGFMALTLSSWFDFIGVNLGLWYYTGLAIPTIPSYVPWDFCLIPVMVMFFLQVKPDASPLLKAVIFAGISAFAGEAFFQWLGFYQPLHWRSWWSFFIYILLYGICHMITRLRTFEKL